MKRIYLDIDSVIAEFGSYFLNYFNIKDKTPATEWKDKRFTDNMHLTKNNIQFWANIPPCARPEELDFDFEGYCTARPIPSDITSMWLVQNGFPDKPVYTVGLGGSKVEILKSLGCTHFLDDAEHNFTELNEAGIKCYLFDRHHNQEIVTHLRVKTIGEFVNKIKTTFLVLGHKEHGKSTLAQMICDKTGLKVEDSSMAAARIFIYDSLREKYDYQSFEECYTDRRNRRQEWFDLIADYNKENETRLAEQILQDNNGYVGMRRIEELRESNRKELFDVVIGIYDPRKPLESADSNTINPLTDSDILIWNDGDLEQLEKKVEKIVNLFGKVKK